VTLRAQTTAVNRTGAIVSELTCSIIPGNPSEVLNAPFRWREPNLEIHLGSGAY